MQGHPPCWSGAQSSAQPGPCSFRDAHKVPGPGPRAGGVGGLTGEWPCLRPPRFLACETGTLTTHLIQEDKEARPQRRPARPVCCFPFTLLAPFMPGENLGRKMPEKRETRKGQPKAPPAPKLCAVFHRNPQFGKQTSLSNMGLKVEPTSPGCGEASRNTGQESAFPSVSHVERVDSWG